MRPPVNRLARPVRPSLKDPRLRRSNDDGRRDGRCGELPESRFHFRSRALVHTAETNGLTLAVTCNPRAVPFSLYNSLCFLEAPRGKRFHLRTCAREHKTVGATD